MPSTPTADPNVALDALRRPILAFAPASDSDERFQSAMLCLADDLDALWRDGEDDTLEAAIVWSALYAFPALTVPGPTPRELVEIAAAGHLMDGETAETLTTLGKVRHTVTDFEPRGFAAALWREMVLSIFATLELFVLLDDDRDTARCFTLLDDSEALADRFSGAA